MTNAHKKGIICDFNDETSLNRAVSELKEHDFSSDEMGMEKIVDEFVEINESKPSVKRPWKIRDSMHAIKQEHGLMAAVMGFVGVGLLFAAIIAITSLERIALAQEPALFITSVSAVIILLSFIGYKWMLSDTKQQFKAKRP